MQNSCRKRCKKSLEMTFFACKLEIRAVMMRRTGVRNTVIMNMRDTNYKGFLEICGNETFYKIMKKRDMEPFHEVCAGVRNISTKPRSPEVGVKHSEILSGLNLEHRMSIRFHSMTNDI